MNPVLRFPISLLVILAVGGFLCQYPFPVYAETKKYRKTEINKSIIELPAWAVHVPKDCFVGISEWSDARWFGLTPLHVAAARGSESIVELLIANGADINDNMGRRNLTPLDCALIRQQHGVIQLLNQHDAKARPERERKRSYIIVEQEYTYDNMFKHPSDLNLRRRR